MKGNTRRAAIGILALAAVIGTAFTDASNRADTGLEGAGGPDSCRLPKRAPVHWLRPLSDGHAAPATRNESFFATGQFRLPKSG